MLDPEESLPALHQHTSVRPCAECFTERHVVKSAKCGLPCTQRLYTHAHESQDLRICVGASVLLLLETLEVGGPIHGAEAAEQLSLVSVFI